MVLWKLRGPFWLNNLIFDFHYFFDLKWFFFTFFFVPIKRKRLDHHSFRGLSKSKSPTWNILNRIAVFMHLKSRFCRLTLPHLLRVLKLRQYRGHIFFLWWVKHFECLVLFRLILLIKNWSLFFVKERRVLIITLLRIGKIPPKIHSK